MLNKILGISLAVAAIQASAAVAPPLTISTVSATPTNVSTGTAGKSAYITGDSYSWTSDYQTVTDFRTQLITAPTTSSPGLEYVYKDVTSSYNDHLKTWKMQGLVASVSADDSQYSGGKGIVLETDITASSATTLTFWLGATGSFTTTTGLFGTVIPALPTFYLATATDPLSMASYGTASTSGSYYSSGTNSYSLTISAGQTLHIKGAVYAGNDVSLSGFTLNFQSAPYDVVENVQYYSNTVSSLYAAHALPALAVPEPETYAMLMAGFGVLALRSKRNKKSVKPA